jgi:polyisoprenyl-teichoic acid--peptidoglycan teichoic acid transferase
LFSQPGRGAPNPRRIVLAALLGLSLLPIGFAVALFSAPAPEKLFHKSHILVLAEGLDYDYNEKDQEYSSGARSDAIKAVNFDFRTNNVYVLSVLRDMDATLPSGREAKINEAQAEGGTREAQAVVAKWLGISGFDRYIVLRIDTTKDLINAIGGIDLNPMNSAALYHTGPNGPIDYDDSWGHLHIHFKPGMQHMNGEQAVSYGRFRHDWCSDPCRIMRQNQVLQAALEKLRTNKLNTVLHLHALIGVFNRDVHTNLTSEEERSLALRFLRVPKNGVHTATAGMPYVTTKMLADGEVLIPNESLKQQQVRSMLLNPPSSQSPSNSRRM